MNIHFSDIEEEKWNSWKWQLQNQIKTLEEVKDKLSLTAEEEQAFISTKRYFKFAVTPYYFSLIEPSNINCPIRKQVLPRKGEMLVLDNEKTDPLAEEKYMPVKGLTHRYLNRVLLYVSHQCSVYCRYCTRKRKVSKTSSVPRKDDMEHAFDYIRKNKRIKEVILSGGDPFNLSENQLYIILKKLKEISHINQIRIHSRYLATLPMRVTLNLCKVLKEFFPIYIVTHFNHVKECTKEAEFASKMLIQEGSCILLNQNVLLSGINDHEDTLMDLYYKLISMGIKPYYLHQCDEVFGSSDFKVSIEKGQRLMKKIRGYMGGINVPLYVVDLTGGGGKVPLESSYLTEETNTFYKFKNYMGNSYEISKN